MKILAFAISLLIGLVMLGCVELNPTPTAFPTVTNTPLPTDTPAQATASPSLEAITEPTFQVAPTVEPTLEAAINPPQILEDKGGVVNVTGLVTYTNPFFTLGVASPLVVLEDQAGFIDRNRDYLMPVQSQVLGRITSEFAQSPFSYNLSLPLEPQGAFRDVDFDGKEERGVQVFAIAYWNNVFGDAYLEERDLGGGGWSSGYASTRVSREPEADHEVVGGTFLVYAPDDKQSFPSNFGEDGLLFTGDEETVPLLEGFTAVNMDQIPFGFDRSHNQVIDLIEPESAALDDFSDMSFSDAFESLVNLMRLEYAFTEYKHLDWDALFAEFRPRFVQADLEDNPEAYRRALRDFSWSIPDGHISGPFLVDEFREAVGGGIGIAIRELDVGDVVISFLLDGGPADNAGIELGAQLLSVNGTDISEYIDNTISFFAPYSTQHDRRLDQLRFATRFPIGDEVDLRYVNPGQTTTQTAHIRASSEVASFNSWISDSQRDGYELPVEVKILDGGVGYVQLFNFSDNDVLTVQLWERMISDFQSENVDDLILDMRENGGGRGFLADQMAAYFFNEPLTLGNTGFYDQARGAFYFDPDSGDRFYLPAESLRYDGKIAVLVGPDCASACEFFSYDMTLEHRATIIGQYPTAGLGGSIKQVAMPLGEQFRFTNGRAVNNEGEIHIEGMGVIPDIRVPVTRETLFSADDPLVTAAVNFLIGEIVSGGDIEVGESITGSIEPGQRVQFALDLQAGQVISILVEASSETRLAFFTESGEELGSTEGRRPSLNGYVVPESFTLIVELSSITDQGVDSFTMSVVDTEG